MTKPEDISRGHSPMTLSPRGLSRAQAATYVGVSVGLFDEMVNDGRMPRPLRINRRKIWHRLQIDDAFDELHNTTDSNPWEH